MGYKTVEKSIQVSADSLILDFIMPEQKYDIGEVVITNREDPAYEKMRQVINKRKYHAELNQQFETDIYLKGQLKLRSVPKSILGIKLDDSAKAEMGLDTSGSGIVYLLEELSHYQYEAPNYSHNKVISVRESGNAQGLGFATMPPIINIYENNLTLLEGLNKRGFISPANSNAFLYYKFKFEGSYMENGKLINKITVIPRRKYEPLFSGTIYVVEDEWVFQAVDLMLTKESQMDMLDTFRIEQTYTSVAYDQWIIQKQVLYPALNLMGFDITGNFLTMYQNSKLNQGLGNENLNKKNIASYDSNATSRNLSYWDSIRPTPLLQEEASDFIKKDSISASQRKKADSLEKAAIWKVTYNDWVLSGASFNKGKNKVSFAPLASIVSYNTVEGIAIYPALGYKRKIDKEQSLKIATTMRYGFSNKHFNPMLSCSYKHTDSNVVGKFTMLKIQGGGRVQQINTNNPISYTMNELYTSYAGLNYMKLYEAKFLEISFKHNTGSGFSTYTSVMFEDRLALFNTSNYTFFKKRRNYTLPNQPQELPLFQNDKAFIIHAGISYQPGWKYISYPNYRLPIPSNLPTFNLAYTKGIPLSQTGWVNFGKWELGIDHSLKMKLAGVVDYNIAAGGFFNKKNVGLPDMIHINGNRTFWASPYKSSFQLAPYYRFSHTASLYGEAHIDWHLAGWLTNKIPLFKRLNWHLVAGNNTLFIDSKNYFTEVHVGLENIGWKLFRFFRVDFIAGYESGVSKPIFGVRIGANSGLFQIAGIGENED